MDRYAPLRPAAVREGADAIAFLASHEPALRTPSTSATPYTVEMAPYAADPAGHHVHASTPLAEFLTPELVDEDSAVRRVANRLGLTPQDLMEQFGTIWQLMRAHHQEVTHTELRSLQNKIEAALFAVVRELGATQAELADVGQEARLAQLQEARTMVVIGGFKKDTPPHVRSKIVFDSLMESDAIKALIWDTHWVDVEDLDNEAKQPLILSLIKGLPTTVRRGQRWSEITLVTFASFDVRTAYLREYGRTGPSYRGKVLRVTPCTPLFARKKEGVLRVLMNAINAHPDHAHCELTPLWHSLTLMRPQPQGHREFDDTLPAWAQVKFQRTQTGKAICELHLDTDALAVINTPSDPATPNSPSLWEKSWNDQWWGRMADLDVAESANIAGQEEAEAYANTQLARAVDEAAQADHAARAEAYALAAEGPEHAPPGGSGSSAAPHATPPADAGASSAQGSREPWAGYAGATVRVTSPHWSTFFTRPGGDNYAPFNYEMIFVTHPPGTLPFDKREYANKTARTNTPPPPPPENAMDVDAALAAGAAAAGTPVTSAVDALAERRSKLEAQRAAMAGQAPAYAPAPDPAAGAIGAADDVLQAAAQWQAAQHAPPAPPGSAPPSLYAPGPPAPPSRSPGRDRHSPPRDAPY